MTVDRCDNCGAPIIWSRTRRGHTIAVAVRPSSHGTLIFVAERIVRVVDPTHVPGRTRWQAHQCPGADWRGVRRETAAL